MYLYFPSVLDAKLPLFSQDCIKQDWMKLICTLKMVKELDPTPDQAHKGDTYLYTYL